MKRQDPFLASIQALCGGEILASDKFHQFLESLFARLHSLNRSQPVYLNARLSLVLVRKLRAQPAFHMHQAF